MKKEMKLSNAEANRFKNLPKRVVDLIKAEEAYLLTGGWSMVQGDKTFSVWKHPEYVTTYSRTFAVLVEISRDGNIGMG